jgi:hypothetical protein
MEMEKVVRKDYMNQFIGLRDKKPDKSFDRCKTLWKIYGNANVSRLFACRWGERKPACVYEF